MSKQQSKSNFYNQQKLYAEIARAYFKSKKIFRYRMKNIEDMDDGEVIQKCHWWYEENNLVNEYKEFEEKKLSGN